MRDYQHIYNKIILGFINNILYRINTTKKILRTNPKPKIKIYIRITLSSIFLSYYIIIIIRYFGALNSINNEYIETAYKFLLKVFYNRTNKNNKTQV
jgi:hypothetical protein